MNLKAEAERYFSKLNPIASRIYADFQDTRNSYECIWNTLSFNEQSQILNECIVKPEVSLQYNLKTNDFTGENKNTNDSLFGIKRILDENVSYRDEHSAPFSFKTLSQVDLRLFGITEAAHKQVTVTPKIEPPKLQVGVTCFLALHQILIILILAAAKSRDPGYGNSHHSLQN